jgi:hypothetical protein
MSDLVVAGLVAGMVAVAVLAAWTIYPAGSRPTDPEAPRRDRLYAVIALTMAMSFPVVIYDHYKIPRWFFGW